MIYQALVYKRAGELLLSDLAGLIRAGVEPRPAVAARGGGWSTGGAGGARSEPRLPAGARVDGLERAALELALTRTAATRHRRRASSAPSAAARRGIPAAPCAR